VIAKSADDESATVKVRTLREEKKVDRWMQQRQGEAMGYNCDTARKSVNQFLKSHDPQISMPRRFADAVGVALSTMARERQAMNSPSDPKPYWKLIPHALLWLAGGILALTCGWPIGLLLILGGIRREAERQSEQTATHRCPKCSRELAQSSRICPRCGHRFPA
jgi:hypothetical protein